MQTTIEASIHTAIHRHIWFGSISKPTERRFFFEESRRHALLRPLPSGGAASVFTLRLGEMEKIWRKTENWLWLWINTYSIFSGMNIHFNPAKYL